MVGMRMGLIFTPVLVRRVLGPLGLSGPMTTVALLGLIDVHNSPVGKHNMPPAAHLIPSCLTIPLYVQFVIIIMKKVAQYPAVSAS